MKRILALLLVFVMVFALVACGGGGNPTDPTEPSDTPTTPSTPEGDESLEGKTLQIWAMVGPEYESVDKIQANVWLWLVRAAMDEWAYINKVNLQYVSNYDQNSLLAAIHSGSKPDFVFSIGKFPEAANLGLLQPLTEEQSAKIVEVIGDTWFQDYRNEHYSVLPPWCGTSLVYYNETMMENYGVTTPMEYIEQGNWTYETYLEICRQCTKDLDSDGKNDTWGSTTYSVGGLWGSYFKMDPETGRLINMMETENTKSALETYYAAVVEEKILLNQYKHAHVAGSGIAMSISDCEPYNFYHTYQVLANGDVIRAVRTPTLNADDAPRYGCTLYQFSIPNGADDADAAVDMICYILKAGMVWLEDHSEGLFETEYEGIVGACEYSAAWLQKYNEFLAERDEKYEEIKDIYNEDFYANMLDEYFNGGKIIGGTYAGISSPWQGAGQFSSIFTEPPASSLPKLSAAVQAMLDKYNSLYVF